MGHVERQRSIEAPAELVWEVMTDPDVYATVSPNLAHVEIVEGDREGMVRRCVDTDGNAWTESCDHWDDGRSFGVAVDVENSDFHRRLFTRFEGTWSLEENRENVLVTMAFEYDVRYGPVGTVLAKYLEYKAGPMMEAIFDGWEAEIESRLDGDDGEHEWTDGSSGGISAR